MVAAVRLHSIFPVGTPKNRRREQSRLGTNQGGCWVGGCSVDARSKIVARWRGSRGPGSRLLGPSVLTPDDHTEGASPSGGNRGSQRTRFRPSSAPEGSDEWARR